MRKNTNPIDGLFRSRLSEVHTPVRADFWEKLNTDLPQVAPKPRLFIRRLAVAATILLILGIGSTALWYASQRGEEWSTPTSGEPSFDFQKIASLPTPTNSLLNDTVQEDIYVNFIAPKIVDHAGYTEELEETHICTISISESYYSFSTNEGVDNQEQTTLPASYGNRNVATNTEKSVQQSTSAKQKRWDIGLNGSYGLLADHTAMYKHKHPWSVGVSVGRKLSKRVRLESGITYTQLNSDIRQASSPHTQTLHYVGIPVKVNVSIKQSKKVDVYAYAGGMAELCVKAKNVATPDPVQVSLAAGLGVSYKISDRLSLYSEPGISYHFDDGSDTQTLRKEKPFNMNLICGVRLTY